MNKYEIALNWLCDQCFHLKIEHGNRCEWVDKCKHIERLKELVEKATPMKPIWEYEDEPICPYCREPLDGDEEHCDLCDQRIDWSEDDENSQRNV